MKYYLIGDDEAVLGFGMIGVEGCVAENREEAEKAFHQALSIENIGIILITGGVAKFIRERIDAYLLNHDFPLILEIPASTGSPEKRPDIREIINKAIGMKI